MTNCAILTSETDNPFRPEGELAKEAQEYVQQLKEKAEQEVNQIINNKTMSSSSIGHHNPSANADCNNEHTAPEISKTDLITPPATPIAASVKPVEESTPILANQEQLASPTNISNGNADKQKKPKTKSKCGCSIS